MSLPLLKDLFVGVDADIVLAGPLVSPPDLSAYADVKFSCVGLGISKSLSTGSTALELQNSNHDIKVHLLAADTALKVPGEHDYQVLVRSGSKWFDLAGVGRLRLDPAR